MCGIAAVIEHNSELPESDDAPKPDLPHSVGEVMKVNEVRGVNAAGVAALYGKELKHIYRELGKFDPEKLDIPDGDLRVLLGHNRWASNGGVHNKNNIHPFMFNIETNQNELTIAGAMNGDVAPAALEKMKLEISGASRKLREQIKDDEDSTDTEWAVAYVAKLMQHERFSLEKAVRQLINVENVGNFAVAFTTSEEPELVCAVIGDKNQLYYTVDGTSAGMTAVSSSPNSLSGVAGEKMVRIEDGQVVKITPETVEHENQGPVMGVPDFDREALQLTGGFQDFFTQECASQPEKASGLIAYLGQEGMNPFREVIGRIPKLEKLKVVATGSSLHASRMAYEIARSYGLDLPEVEIVDPKNCGDIEEGTLLVFVSQSGGTADLVSEATKRGEEGTKSVAIINVENSGLGDQVDASIYIKAGFEKAVPATKSVMNQVIASVHMYLELHRQRQGGATYLEKHIAQLPEELEAFYQQLEQEDHSVAINDILDDTMVETLNKQSRMRRVAKKMGWAALYPLWAKRKGRKGEFSSNLGFITIGHGSLLPVADETGLKIQETSGIITQSLRFPDELKHGRIESATLGAVAIGLLLGDGSEGDQATVRNIQNYAAQGGRAFLIDPSLEDVNLQESPRIGRLPMAGRQEGNHILQQLQYLMTGQRLALIVADRYGKDPDQPSALAKTITV